MRSVCSLQQACLPSIKNAARTSSPRTQPFSPPQVNTAQQTYDALVAAKGGDADRIVMLGLIPGVGCGPGGLHWAQLIGLFGPHGIQGEVCSPDYNGFFQDAVTTILDACVINPG